MPSRNRAKTYASNTFYHVYNRGVNKDAIFLEDEDYSVFLNLLKRYLSSRQIKDARGRPYDNLSKQVELLAYCLMPNHFHLLLFQNDAHGITRLLRRVMNSYVGYFNKKYNRLGHLFQDVYKASDIDNEAYLWHISRYIHLNPMDIDQDWQAYPYSSIGYYLGKQKASWIRPKRILDMHEEQRGNYLDFLKDYQDYQKTLNDIKLYSAN